MSPADADRQASLDDEQPLQSGLSEAQDMLLLVSMVDWRDSVCLTLDE